MRPLRRTGRRAAAALTGAALLALGLAAWRSGLTCPEATLLVQDRDGRFLGELAGAEPEEAGYWPLADLPERVVAATLAVEDRRFYRHPGIDPLAIGRAVRQNWRHGRRISGASTIAMQVARMQHPGPRIYARKSVEALTAVLLTARHGRSAVLAHYLRIVPYGNRIHGIAYAARRYLDKPVEDLSWAETAFLTAIPQSPARMNPFRPDGRARAARRGADILDRLKAEGALSAEEHALARRQILSLAVPPPAERPHSSLHALLRLARDLDRPGVRRALAARPILRTSLDLELQEEVSWRALRAVDHWQAEGAGNAAVVVVDLATSAVRAWVGSTDYFDRDRAGAIDFAQVRRSPGSALKPFLYALALDRGVVTPASVLDDLERGPGGIGNADGLFLGPLLPRAALANSRNVPAAELVARTGLDEAHAFLRELGLHDGSVSARRVGLGLAIGGLEVSLEQLVQAYTVLATDGRLRELGWYAGQPRTRERRVLSEDAARTVTLFLSDPLARLPTFPRMSALEYPFPVAVKTGTSSRFRDAWTVAYSRDFLVGVWLGHPDFRSMNRLTGFNSAATLAREILLFLHQDQVQGLEDVSFPPPRSSQAVRLCALSGQRAGEACDRVSVEHLRPGEAPVDTCQTHVRVLVDSRTGRPADARTPRAVTEARVFVDLPPRYAVWAAGAGLVRPPDSRYPTLATERSFRLNIVSPEDGLRVLRDPETPPGFATLGLSAEVSPAAPQIVWYVDGAPFQVADYPYATRWPLSPGEHVFQARLLQGDLSSVVRIRVD